jgi:hypothetical protein
MLRICSRLFAGSNVGACWIHFVYFVGTCTGAMPPPVFIPGACLKAFPDNIFALPATTLCVCEFRNHKACDTSEGIAGDSSSALQCTGSGCLERLHEFLRVLAAPKESLLRGCVIRPSADHWWHRARAWFLFPHTVLLDDKFARLAALQYCIINQDPKPYHITLLHG